MAVALTEYDTFQADQFRVNPQNGHWMYFRLSDDFGPRKNWIIPAPAWDSAMAHNAIKGMRPLGRYGTFFDEQPGWLIRTDPFRQILARDGARDFPLSQIVELEWHRKPPVVNGQLVVFPQVERDEDGNVVLERDTHGKPTKVHRDWTCVHCGTVRKTELGLRNHEATVHKEIASTDQLARGLSKANEAQADVMATALGAIIGQLSETVKALGQRQNEQDERFMALMEKLAGVETPTRRPGRPPKHQEG